MSQLAYFLIFVLLAPLLFSFWVEGVRFLASIPNPAALKWFGLGFILYFLAGLILIGPVVRFLEVTVHELAHSIMGLIFLNPTKALAANSETGGETVFTRKPNPLVALAPYYLPLLTLPLLLVKPLAAGLGALVNNVLNFLIGVTLGFHYVMHIRQIDFRQPDLRDTGLIVSIGLIYTLMLIFLVITILVVLGRSNGVLTFLTTAVGHAPRYYTAIIAWVGGLAGGL